MPLRGNVSLELEQEVVCRYDRLQVDSKVVCHGVVPSCAFQSQFDHRELVGYGVAGDSCGLPSCG